MKILWCDFETGGLDWQVHSPLSIGLLATDGEQIIGEAEFQLRDLPLVVDPGALKVNKIDLTVPGLNHFDFSREYQKFMGDKFFNGYTITHRNNKYGKPYEHVQIDGWHKDKSPLFGGHNTSFDRPWLYKVLGSKFDQCQYHSVDTMSLGACLKAAGKIHPTQSLSLQALADYYEISHDKTQAHTALADCKLAFMIFNKMKELLK